MDIGLFGGANIASRRGNSVLKKYHYPSIAESYGASFSYDFSSRFSLISDLTIGRNKTVLSDDSKLPYGNAHGEYLNRYISIPLAAVYYFGNQRIFYLKTGVYLGVYFNHYTKIYDFWENEDLITEYDNFRVADFGITGGLGLRKPINNKVNLSIEVLNNLGLLDLFEEEYDDSQFKMNTVVFKFGINYKLGNSGRLDN